MILKSLVCCTDHSEAETTPLTAKYFLGGSDFPTKTLSIKHWRQTTSTGAVEKVWRPQSTYQNLKGLQGSWRGILHQELESQGKDGWIKLK